MSQLGFNINNNNNPKNLNDLKRLITADPRTGKERTGKRQQNILRNVGKKNGEFQGKIYAVFSFVDIFSFVELHLLPPLSVSLALSSSERRNGCFYGVRRSSCLLESGL
jgi:hypothetical protein